MGVFSKVTTPYAKQSHQNDLIVELGILAILRPWIEIQQVPLRREAYSYGPGGATHLSGSLQAVVG